MEDSGPAGVTGVRLYTRAPVTVPWLARSVVPVARELRDQGFGIVYLRRGWLHGPHVNIIAKGARGAVPGWPEIAARLDAGPLDPGRALTDEVYLAQAREFGRLEAVAPPYLPMRDHGAVEYVGTGELGSREPKLDSLRDIVFSVLTGPMMTTIEELSGSPASATVRLAEAFAALADTHFLGLPYGVFALRSHAEAFLAWAAPSADVRPAFAKRLVAEAPLLRPVVANWISGEPGRIGSAWRTAFGYCAGALDSAVASDALTLALLEEVADSVDRTAMGPPGAPGAVPAGSRPDSAFHAAVEQSGVVSDPSPWYAAYRVLLNLFYEQLPLLTVSPLQRYYMCYAIAELADDVLGESWQDRLRREQARSGVSAP
jgi:hypothetical protein